MPQIKSFESAINSAILLHGDKYRYDKTSFIKRNEKSIITCKIHGDFVQAFCAHLRGQGCPKCKTDKVRRSKVEFIKRASIIHKNKFDYSQSEYYFSGSMIDIICPVHGLFTQRARYHLVSGCPKCSYDLSSYKKDDWIKKAKNKEGTFYIIHCFSENESFFKLGITYNNVKIRYKNKTLMPYNYKIVKIITSSNLSYIWNLEKRFKRLKLTQHYVPNISFNGSSTECFK